MREMLIAFLVLIGAPFCMGLLPAMAMPGEAEREGSGHENALPEGAARSEGPEEKSRKKRSRGCVYICPAAVYLAGFLLSLAVFQILAVPVIVYRPWGFSWIVKGYSLLLLAGSVAGICVGIPVLRGFVRDAGRLLAERKRLSPETCLYWLMALGLVLFQMYMAYTHAFFDGDDAYYVAQSVIAEQSDVLYRILPYTGLTTSLDVRHALAALPIWEAYVARVTGIHPAIIAHSVLPLVLLPATYLLYFRIGMRLFRRDGRKTAIFMILVCLLQIFGNTSIYTNATFFLTRTWQGKSILCNLILLAELWALLHLWENRENVEDGQAAAGPEGRCAGGKKYGQAGWWLVLTANNVVAAMTTTMGAFLAGLFVAVAGLVWAVREKRPAVLLPLAASCIPCVVYLAWYVALAG